MAIAAEAPPARVWLGAMGRLRKTAELVQLNLKHLDPYSLQASELVEASKLFAEIGKLAHAGTLLLAPAIERSGAFRKEGHKNTAEMLAKQSGSSLGAAHAAVNTAKKLRAKPKTAEALRNGKLSGAQAGVLGDAHPDDEESLLDAAEHGFGRLRDAAETAKAARTSEEDAMERYRRVHAERNLRSWTKNGAFHLAGSTTLDEGAALMAALEAERTRLFEQARKEGRQEDPSAYAMDALVNVLTGAAPQAAKAKASVRLRADAAAIIRGYLEADECCEIRDYGPIPVAIARALMLDADVTGVVIEGNDVRSVSSSSRSISRKLREALNELYPTCAVPGCCVSKNLEVDHVHEYAKGGLTEIANLVLLCRAHHRLKTIYGWRVGGPSGARTWLPPPTIRAA